MDKTVNFISKVVKIHADRYNYDKVEYVGAKKKVTIICKEHGEFNQTPNKHLGGQGCPDCGKASSIKNRKSNTADFVIKANKLHNNIYSYGNVTYENNSTKVSISCPLHGNFNQTPSSHLNGNGCPDCGSINSTLKQTHSKQDFIKKARLRHGDKFNYDNVVYINTNLKIKIICPVHGEFEQKPSKHLLHDCNKCGQIKANENSRTIPIRLKKTSYNLTRRLIFYRSQLGCEGKRPHILKILGTSWIELLHHLEDNPYGFKVDGEGIDLDHIKPLNSCGSEEELYKLNHWSNLQLLPRYYNQYVKRNNKFDPEGLKNWLKNKDNYETK